MWTIVNKLIILFFHCYVHFLKIFPVCFSLYLSVFIFDTISILFPALPLFITSILPFIYIQYTTDTSVYSVFYHSGTYEIL